MPPGYRASMLGISGQVVGGRLRYEGGGRGYEMALEIYSNPRAEN